MASSARHQSIMLLSTNKTYINRMEVKVDRYIFSVSHFVIFAGKCPSFDEATQKISVLQAGKRLELGWSVGYFPPFLFFSLFNI